MSSNQDEEVVILLTAIFSWNETQRALKYYVPNTISENLLLPISETQWHQLIKKIKKFGNEDCKNNMVCYQNFIITSFIIFIKLIFICLFIFHHIVY